MSIRVLSAVRCATIGPGTRPDGKTVGAHVRKLVMMSMADRANDDGSGCWPAVETVAAEAECSERVVQYAIRSLEADGLLAETDRATRDRPTVYAVNVAALEARGVHPGSFQGCTRVHPNRP